MKTALALILLAVSLQAQAAQKTVCTVTVNSSNEKESFKRNLPSGDFKFVELTDYDKNSTSLSGRNESQWLKNACDSGIQCDILVVSAHFGGFFFGSSGYQISTPTLEGHSCNNTCDGVLKHPTEIFLYGCNTLAEKDKDHRTQQQYVDVLIADGYRPEIATQVAETRYGAVGPTFKDQMRRIFPGVPHIYGFSSTAPKGSQVGPALDRYFKSIPNYAAHLSLMSRSLEANTELSASMPRDMIQVTGVGTTPNDAGVPFRKQICELYDTKTSIAQKTSSVAHMLESTDMLIYLPSVTAFLNHNITQIRTDSWANEALEKVAHDEQTMGELEKLTAKTSKASVSVQLDVLDLEVKLGRIERSDFEARAQQMLMPLVRTLSNAHADTLCAAVNAHNLKLNVTASDFAPGTLNTNAALTALQCLQTSDEAITQTVIPLINADWLRHDGNAIRSYLLALVRLPGRNADKIKTALYVNKFTSSFAPYAYGVLTVAQSGQDQLNAAATLVGMDVNNIALVYDLMQSLPQNNDLAVALLGALPRSQSKQSRRQQMVAILRTLPRDSAYWTNVAAEIKNSDIMMQAIYMGHITNTGRVPTAIADLAIDLLQGDSNFVTYFAAAVAKANLTPNQISALVEIANRNPLSGKAGLIRWAVSTQPNLPTQLAKSISGDATKAICEQIQDVVQCRFERTRIKRP